MTVPVLLHIPHSSIVIPEPYRSRYLVGPDKLALENLRLADLYTDELYDLPGATRAVFPVSRFLVDAERFSDDAQEPMAARGMGALYTVTTHLEPLRPQPDDAERAELLERYYHPHHAFLDDWADRALAQAGTCLVIDCHSFPSKALPYEGENQSLPRPEICIGTDPFHTPEALKALMNEYFTGLGYQVGIDVPFSGALTPARHYGCTKGVKAFMIEVRKDLYMDEETGAKTPNFLKVKADLGAAMKKAQDSITV